MRYVLQVVLSNAQHPEYGQATIPFPIPNQNYPKKIKRSVPHEHTENRPHPQTGHYDSG